MGGGAPAAKLCNGSEILTETEKIKRENGSELFHRRRWCCISRQEEPWSCVTKVTLWDPCDLSLDRVQLAERGRGGGGLGGVGGVSDGNKRREGD